MDRWQLWIGLLFCAVSFGCDDSTAPPAEVPQPGPAATSSEVATPAPEGQMEEPESPEPVAGIQSAAVTAPQGVEARILDWDGIENLIRAQEGKVVVLDLWATYCVPCRKEFPNLVALHNRLGDKVTCISVSLDYDGLEDHPVEKCRDEVLAFLQEQQATCTNVVCSTPAEEVYGKKIPSQSVPAVYVFNKKGELADRFPNPTHANPDDVTYASHIVPFVEKLLAE